MEKVRTGEGSGPINDDGIGPLWRAYLGIIVLTRLQPQCVIDRCAAEVGVLEWRVRDGGTRTAGLRPRAIDPGILQNRASFFQNLRSSVAEVGIKVPLLVWGINGKLWLRYGASRVHTAQGLGFLTAPAVLCAYAGVPDGFLVTRELHSPTDILDAFGPPREVGHFIVDHERIDAHRMEP